MITKNEWNISLSLYNAPGCFLSDVQVIDYYNKKNVVANLHAEKPPDAVSAEVHKVLS